MATIPPEPSLARAWARLTDRRSHIAGEDHATTNALSLSRFHDPLSMPGTGESLEARLAQAAPLAGTPGQAYVERRSVPELVAAAADVRFDYERRGAYGLSPSQRRALREQVSRQRCALNGRLEVRWLDFTARLVHVVEPDGGILLEGVSEARDVVLGYIPAGVLA